MVLNRRVVNWDTVALKQLEAVCNYIRKDSLQNAQKLRREIFTHAKSLAKHAEKHPLDKYRHNNDGTFRAFEKYHLRVAYCILPDEIKIINVRHTKMEPREY